MVLLNNSKINMCSDFIDLENDKFLNFKKKLYIDCNKNDENVNNNLLFQIMSNMIQYNNYVIYRYENNELRKKVRKIVHKLLN